MKEFIEEKRVKYKKTDGVVDCYLDFYRKCGQIVILKIPDDYVFVHKGDELYRMSYSSEFYGKVLYATEDGFFVNYSEKFPKIVQKGYHLYSIYNTSDALQQSIFYSTLKLGEDEFSKDPYIKATMYGGNKYGFSFGIIYIRIEYTHNKHRLNMDYSSTRLKLKKNHILHFLLDDGSVLTFGDFTKPIKYLNNSDRGNYINMTTSSILKYQDIQSLAAHKVVKWNLMNDEGSTLAEQDVLPVINMPDDLKDIQRIAFKDYISKYLSIYNEIKTGDNEHVKYDNKSKTISEDQIISSSTCFVYLMVDTTNNFHKIGISNNPRYREHTLQSDKPTIELLCAKEYPSRALAEAIESALHRVYANKRIRGEWFNLDVSDIEEIKQTLE